MFNILPFVGRSYSKSKLRVMVMGETFYSSESWENLSDLMNIYLDPDRKYDGWMNSLKRFERSLYGNDTTLKDSMNIWNSLLFYDYVQAVQDPRKSITPTKEQYTDSEEAFFQIMERYQPDILIVWGLRLWNNLPNTNWTENARKCIGGDYFDNGFYTLNNNHRVTSFPIDHPAGAFDTELWHEVISGFVIGEIFITQDQNVEEGKEDTNKLGYHTCHNIDEADYKLSTLAKKEGIIKEINDFYCRNFTQRNIDKDLLYKLIAKECTEKIRKQSEWFFLQKVLIVKRCLTTRAKPTDFGRFVNNILIFYNICGYKKKKDKAGIDPTELTRYGNQNYYLNGNSLKEIKGKDRKASVKNITIHWNDLDECEYNNRRDKKRQVLELDEIKNLCDELDEIISKSITDP